ncbi:MAG: hypothetical protein [Caudoviricetes sp.]|nr:MAG: hypothetical protein [Caudoviricetes sp.]
MSANGSNIKNIKNTSDPVRSVSKDLEATLPKFSTETAQTFYNKDSDLAQASSEFQNSITKWLRSGKSYDELMDYLKKECEKGKTAYEEEIAEEKRRAAEAAERARLLAANRKDFIESLMNYLYYLGLIEAKDLSDDKNVEKLEKILKDIEKGLEKKHSKLGFNPFCFNFDFDFNNPRGRRSALRLFEDVFDLDLGEWENLFL